MQQAKKFRIAVNTRFLLPEKLEGIGVFTFEIFSRMAKQHPEIDFIYLFDRPFDTHFITSENITPKVLFPPARHPFLWHWWFQFSLKKFLEHEQPDLFISPDGFIPLKCKVPCISVIHDLNFEYFPQFVPFLVRKFYKYFFPKFARKAARIVTVSNFSKKNIEAAYHIFSNKIEVVYNAASAGFKPLLPEEKDQAIFHFSQGKPYFAFVGAINPRKNIGNLLLAFNKFKHTDQHNYNLLIAGNAMFKTAEIARIYQGLKFKNNIIFTGRIPEAQLPNFVGGAHALVLVSHFEGFGIPLVEAMACAVPVIAARNSAMPEIVGVGGVLVNSESIEEIADAMYAITAKPRFYEQLKANAAAESVRFSWDASAEKMYEIIQKTIDL